MVPTTGLEPINRVFSPLPALASFSVFITHKVTTIISKYKHKLRIFGKSREENSVQIACKKLAVQTLCKAEFAPDSVQTCARISRQVYHLLFPRRTAAGCKNKYRPPGHQMTFDLMQKKSCIAEIFKTSFQKIFQPVLA